MSLDELRRVLSTTAPGTPERDDLESLLTEGWESLDGHEQGGMTADKLLGRVEDVHWDPPYLSFTIERHGGMVQGSSGAELQEWVVDVVSGSATLRIGRYRQKLPKSPPLRVDPIVDSVVKAVLTHSDAPGLRWNADGSVRILIGELIPADGHPKQTVEGRRKRFWQVLTLQLAPHGWQVVRPNLYRHTG